MVPLYGIPRSVCTICVWQMHVISQYSVYFYHYPMIVSFWLSRPIHSFPFVSIKSGIMFTFLLNQCCIQVCGKVEKEDRWKKVLTLQRKRMAISLITASHLYKVDRCCNNINNQYCYYPMLAF
jgi:hypothetical protein